MFDEILKKALKEKAEAEKATALNKQRRADEQKRQAKFAQEQGAKEAESEFLEIVKLIEKKSTWGEICWRLENLPHKPEKEILHFILKGSFELPINRNKQNNLYVASYFSRLKELFNNKSFRLKLLHIDLEEYGTRLDPKMLRERYGGEVINRIQINW